MTSPIATTNTPSGRAISAIDEVAVALVHRGWVRTDMGGASAQISPQESAAGLIEVIDRVTLDDSPCFKTWAGDDHVW